MIDSGHPGHCGENGAIMTFPIAPPIEPMLAKLADGAADGRRLPVRAEMGRVSRHRVSRRHRTSSSRAATCGRSIGTFRSCTRSCSSALPDGCVLDGEIVIATPHGLDFDALQLRLHPAASRVAKLAAGDAGGVRRVRRCWPPAAATCASRAAARAPRARSNSCWRTPTPPIHLTPMTRDRAVAAEWLVALRRRRPRRRDRQAGGRHLPARQARDDQGQARAHRRLRRRRLSLAQERERTLVGSLLLGLYDDRGALHHVGVTSSFTMARRKELVAELAPLRKRALENHPWREWAEAGERRDDADARRPEPLERGQGSVVGAAADRARVRGQVRPHAGRSVPPRGDLSCAGVRTSRPRDCRYDQLEVTTPYELEKVFGAQAASGGNDTARLADRR